MPPRWTPRLHRFRPGHQESRQASLSNAGTTLGRGLQGAQEGARVPAHAASERPRQLCGSQGERAHSETFLLVFPNSPLPFIQFTKLPIPHEYYFKLLNQQGLSGIPTKGKKSNTERNHVNPCKTKAILHGFRRTFPGTEGLGRRLE